MYQNSFATVLEALAATRYRVQLANGTVLESTYYGAETFTVADRVFVEYLGVSNLWMIASGAISAPQSYSSPLTAALSFGGSLSASRIIPLGIAASLNPAGTLKQGHSRTLAGTLTLDGTLTIPAGGVTLITLTASLTFTSSIVRRVRLWLKGFLVG